mmetsp:Transcript_13012/g.23557  ORF Transcript_13012/g.23557 Transcript_13012/m.23557 type:complete len:345 (+) Transcript_13012:40-1074(+)
MLCRRSMRISPHRRSCQPITLLLLLLNLSLYNVFAFVSFQLQNLALFRWRNGTQNTPPRSTSLSMALTPVGPFCPFRSTAAIEMEPRMENLSSVAPGFATEMARIQLDIQTGNTPDPERLRNLAKGLDQAVEEWESLLTRLKLSNDFQTREYAKLNQAHLETHGVSAEVVASMMKWQSGCMKAMADSTPPPMPPPDLDLLKMMEQSNTDNPPPSITSMTSAEKITATPFSDDSDMFDSPTVRDEYKQLCEDHANLIEMGASYANFDPSGNIAYIDEIEKIDDRWQVFFARFKLMGKLDKEFVRQCDAFLASMGMNEEQYQELLKKAHQIMRDDAERERNMMGSA